MAGTRPSPRSNDGFWLSPWWMSSKGIKRLRRWMDWPSSEARAISAGAMPQVLAVLARIGRTPK